MKIYQSSGYEKHKLIFITYVIEGLSGKRWLLWGRAPINGKTTNSFWDTEDVGHFYPQYFHSNTFKLKFDREDTLPQTVDSVKCACWLAGQTPNVLYYLPPSNSQKMACWFASVTSEEIIQINFLRCILSHCFSIYENNYSSQCWWQALDIYLAALRLGKYPLLTTSTSVNSC